MPMLLPLIVLGGAATVALIAKAASAASGGEKTGKPAKGPQKLTAAQLTQLKGVLNVIFGMIGKDSRLTVENRKKAATIMTKDFKRPGIANSILKNVGMPDDETWPGSETSARDFIAKAYKAFLAQGKAQPEHTVPEGIALPGRGEPGVPTPQYGTGVVPPPAAPQEEPTILPIFATARQGMGHFVTNPAEFRNPESPRVPDITPPPGFVSTARSGKGHF